MLRVQDSLDWAATFNSNLASMGCERGDVELYSSINSTVLKIPMSAARHNLVTGNNFEVFLAEHIVALDDDSLSNPEALRDLKSPGLTFYMLPIRGLGQWRAAIDWIERKTGNDGEAHDNYLGEELRKQSSKLSKAALEELLSLSLVNIFAHSVRRSLAPFQFNLDRQREKLCEAFGLLWFSKEISFFKDGICLDLWRRDPHTSQLVSSKELAKGVTLAQADWEQIGGNYPGFFLCNKNRHPELTTIRLNLNPIIQSLKLQSDDAAILKSDSPYDAVESSAISSTLIEGRYRGGLTESATASTASPSSRTFGAWRPTATARKYTRRSPMDGKGCSRWPVWPIPATPCASAYRTQGNSPRR